MKIYSAAQTRAWDDYTIEHQGITSLDLMNRAVQTFVDWYALHFKPSKPVLVICGTGNNGGDGIAIARQLSWLDFEAKVVVCDFAEKRSADFEAQYAHLSELKSISHGLVRTFQEFEKLLHEWLLCPSGVEAPVLIDALFGSGLNRPLEGDWAQVVEYLNQLPHEILAIDIPSGLFADVHTPGDAVIKARWTFSFERPKRAFYFPENAERVGEWAFKSIGLLPDFEFVTKTSYYHLSPEDAQNLYRPRSKFAHKGSFGHALIIAGSFGKMGAAVLASRACLRSGVGLLSVHAPRSGNIVLQTAVPEAMVSADHRAKFWSEAPDLQAYSSIGVGPGIGKAMETARALEQLLKACNQPLVLDADALNLLSEHPAWWEFLPKNSILTPHPKEFERLFGKTTHDFQRNDLQREKALEHGVFIVLKGAHTAIACPDGECWFNATGNPGMATGGTGDVLTGMLTGLLAQGYPPKSAALLGVYLHGLAGDFAALEKSQEALVAGDLVEYLGEAWKQVKSS